MELSLLDKVHEPLEREDSRDERDEHSREEFRGERAAFRALGKHFRIFYRVERLALDPFDEVEERCAADGRDAHEERKFASVLAVRSHEEHGGNCGTAAADARDAGNALHRSRD